MPSLENQNPSSSPCQTIGDLTTIIAQNAKLSDTTPMPLPSNSETTTSLARQNLPAGTPPSLPGLATLRALAADVLEARPLDETSLGTLLAQHFGSRLVIKTRNRPVYSPNFGYDEVPDGWDISLDNLGTEEGKFLEALEFFNRPATPDFIALQMARLRAAMPRAAESNMDIEVLIDVMVEDCSGYPPDVIASTVRAWRQNERFFPSPSEFRKRLDAAVKYRRTLLDAFKVGKNKAISSASKPAMISTNPDRHTLSSEKWTAAQWDEHIDEARKMLDLSRANPALLSENTWHDELSRRMQNKANFYP